MGCCCSLSQFFCGQCPLSFQINSQANMMPVRAAACVNFSTPTRPQSMTQRKRQLLQLEDTALGCLGPGERCGPSLWVRVTWTWVSMSTLMGDVWKSRAMVSLSGWGSSWNTGERQKRLTMSWNVGSSKSEADGLQ